MGCWPVQSLVLIRGANYELPPVVRTKRSLTGKSRQCWPEQRLQQYQSGAALSDSQRHRHDLPEPTRRTGQLSERVVPCSYKVILSSFFHFSGSLTSQENSAGDHGDRTLAPVSSRVLRRKFVSVYYDFETPDVSPALPGTCSGFEIFLIVHALYQSVKEKQFNTKHPSPPKSC